ncbi:MAG: glycosyltransferase family 4 protein [Sphingobium sp.]
MADSPRRKRPHILHAHSTFDLGGKEARAVRLMNHWDGRLEHTILSAQPDAMGARAQINPAVECHFPADAPSLQGWPAPGRYGRLARYMARFDLVLTYNWGAMDAVMAHRIFSPLMRLPVLIHHEDGFNADEADGLKLKRNYFRRIALGSAHALVVPSTRLHDIARDVWYQRDAKVRLIPNGIDVTAYASPVAADAIPGLVRDPAKLLVGTLAGLRAVKNLPRLVRAIAPLKDRLQLVIVGEGPERDAIAQEASAHGVDLHLAGFMGEPWRFVGAFDIFALSSDSEQFPISLVEAMAAGLPVVSTDVGDVRAMVAQENRAFVVPRDDESALTQALLHLAENAALRTALGAANRQRAQADYAESNMIKCYENLYADALNMPF